MEVAEGSEVQDRIQGESQIEEEMIEIKEENENTNECMLISLQAFAGVTL